MAGNIWNTKNVFSFAPWAWNDGQDVHAALHLPLGVRKGNRSVLAMSVALRSPDMKPSSLASWQRICVRSAILSVAKEHGTQQ